MQFNVRRNGTTTLSWSIALLIFLSSTTCIPVSAQTKLVACDLIDQQLASVLLQAPIKQHSPNRTINGGNPATSSDCIFFAQRSTLRTQLFEYPSQADAMRAIRAATAPGGSATVASEKGLGDEAFWWNIGSEARGFYVRKGKLVLVLDTRWNDATSTDEVRARLRSNMPS